MTTYQQAVVDGSKIFYREDGPKDRPTILLPHGFPTSSHMFRNLIPALADRYHLVAPDLPDFGFSDAPDRKAFRYSFENLAKVPPVRTPGLSTYRLVADGRAHMRTPPPDARNLSTSVPTPGRGPSAAMGSSIEVRLSNGRNLMVSPGFDESHLRTLLEVMVVRTTKRKPSFIVNSRQEASRPLLMRGLNRGVSISTNF